MHRKPVTTRRRFLSGSVQAAAAAAPYFVPARALAAPGRTGANDKIHVGVIGFGNLAKGWHFPELLKQPDAVIASVCDVWKERLDDGLAQARGTAKPYTDYREMLRDDGIDAVVIATPPHWHALMAIHAAEARKNFYVEKPMTLHLGESLAVARAARRHNVVTQVGTQIHASDNYRRVVEIVRSGQLGKINVVRTFMVMNQGPEGIGHAPQGEPPPGIDWDMWLGPAPRIPYNPLIVKSAYENCSFMAHSGGWTPGMAPHIIDLPTWALGLGIPRRTFCSGGRYCVRDMGDSPDTQEVLWEHDDLTLTWWMSLVNSYGFDFQDKNIIRRRLGVWFHGVNGTLMANYGTHRVVPEGDRLQAAASRPTASMPSSPGHHRDWLDGIRKREQPACHVGYHYKLDVAIALANLSMRLQRAIHFDPKTEQILNDPEAARLAVPVYRDPWKFPEEYLRT